MPFRYASLALLLLANSVVFFSWVGGNSTQKHPEAPRAIKAHSGTSSSEIVGSVRDGVVATNATSRLSQVSSREIEAAKVRIWHDVTGSPGTVRLSALTVDEWPLPRSLQINIDSNGVLSSDFLQGLDLTDDRKAVYAALASRYHRSASQFRVANLAMVKNAAGNYAFEGEAATRSYRDFIEGLEREMGKDLSPQTARKLVAKIDQEGGGFKELSQRATFEIDMGGDRINYSKTYWDGENVNSTEEINFARDKDRNALPAELRSLLEKLDQS